MYGQLMQQQNNISGGEIIINRENIGSGIYIYEVTDKEGRISDLVSKGQPLSSGTYRITFELKSYFAGQNRKSFYPSASIVFDVEDPKQHYHVPLLLSGFGFSTYRGS